MNIDFITKDDLQKFKAEFTSEMKKVFSEELTDNPVKKCSYIKAKRVLEELDISQSKLDSLVKKGVLPQYKLLDGAANYFKIEDLDTAFTRA